MSSIQNDPAPPSDTTRSRPATSADPAESLAYEAELARAAMAAKFQELKTSLQTAADPRAWAERHPWVAVSVAAATGFAAATAIASERKERRRDYDRRRDDPRDFAREDAASRGAASGGWTAMLFELAKILFNSHLLPMFQAWQQSMAEQAAQAAAQPSAPPDEVYASNGYHPSGAANGSDPGANGPGMGID